MSQAEHPHGLLGPLFGRIMAVLNADMETRVADMLGLTGTESVLEVGFGPGVGISHPVRRLPHGAVAGVEISQEMVTAAAKRNRHAVASGAVDLRVGASADLAWPDGAFDAVMAVNCVQFWHPLEQHLTETRRVLRPGGRLAIGVHASSLPEGQSNAAGRPDPGSWIGDDSDGGQKGALRRRGVPRRTTRG